MEVSHGASGWGIGGGMGLKDMEKGHEGGIDLQVPMMRTKKEIV
jgi:hypothetical protein